MGHVALYGDQNLGSARFRRVYRQHLRRNLGHIGLSNETNRRRFIDKGAAPVNAVHMEPEDIIARKPDEPLAALVRQDLDPLSVAELEARIIALEGEIARCRKQLDASVNHRATAEALFKR
jgi:uncharacterized small protein (DUF1192 family)